jgi:hypothetical protein
MKYLKDSIELAESLGYFKYPEVLAQINKVPKWFKILGTNDGVKNFENKFGSSMPIALQEFYRCLPLACFLELTIDGNVFFKELADEELPLVVNWSSTNYLAFAFHGHSGSICAANLSGEENPLVFWGYNDESEHYQDVKRKVTFSDWIFSFVNVWEKELSSNLELIKECKTNPEREKRLMISLDYYRHLPGMADLLKKENL